MPTAHRRFHRGRFRRAALLAGLCALTSLPAVAGELYQWKDADGVTHYSDSPPPNQAYESRDYRESTSAPVAKADAKPADAPSSQCTTARANLELLQGDGPVGMDENQDGKPDTPFSAEQREAQRKLAEAAIDVHCKSQAPVGEA